MTSVRVLHFNQIPLIPGLEGLLSELDNFGYRHDSDKNHRLAVAFSEDTPTGVLHYSVSYNRLDSYGTFVSKRFRKKRVGFDLWSHVLTKETKVRNVSVLVTSIGGMRLISNLCVAFPHLSWDIVSSI